MQSLTPVISILMTASACSWPLPWGKEPTPESLLPRQEIKDFYMAGFWLVIYILLLFFFFPNIPKVQVYIEYLKGKMEHLEKNAWGGHRAELQGRHTRVLLQLKISQTTGGTHSNPLILGTGILPAWGESSWWIWRQSLHPKQELTVMKPLPTLGKKRL